MRVLIVGLTYGKRPMDIIRANLSCTGYPATHTFVNREGIANALNEGIDIMKEHSFFDAIAFLSNDIIEPENWLAKKVEALQTYPDAGIIASSLDYERKEIQHELIISNWLISKKTIDRIGYFNESMFPYGPIDLDYYERCNAVGIKTYYAMNCLAHHPGKDATGTEYGWDKGKLVESYWPLHHENTEGYKNGTKSTYLNRL